MEATMLGRREGDRAGKGGAAYGMRTGGWLGAPGIEVGAVQVLPGGNEVACDRGVIVLPGPWAAHR
jgi:hypothetical protein